FDLKDDLTDNEGVGGDLADLNDRLQDVFGPKLFTRDEWDGMRQWPDVNELKDRVLCVLSGNPTTRVAYRWAFGSEPAVGVNRKGDLILLYRSTAGDINCWTGRAQQATIDWLRKSNYASSDLGLSQPAVAVNDDGWIVSVHRFSRPNLPNRLEA